MARLRIAEIFTSIQGEGQWMGVPSTFIRVSGCNLRCGWCDTPYASWDPEGSMIDIDSLVREAQDRRVRHVVLTGGEPMLFDPIEELVCLLAERSFLVTIETAGTVFRELPCHLMSISPKLANSAPDDLAWRERHESLRQDREPLAKLVAAYRDRLQLKFVVNPETALEAQIDEIDSVLAVLGEVAPDQVYLMPEGIDDRILQTRERLLVPVCIDRGWRLAPRFHIRMFGNTKGT